MGWRAFLGGLALAAGLGGVVQAQPVTDYLLQPGDRIEITVLEDPSLNRQLLVRPDGRINMPLAGSVVAGGLTPEAVQRAIAGRLAREFVDAPSVTVALVQLAETTEDEEDLAAVFVVGEVQRPGRYEYEFDEPITALQALSLAGGPGIFAARKRIQIRRIVDGTEFLFNLDYDNLESGGAAGDLTPLVDGDVIVVPEAGFFE